MNDTKVIILAGGNGQRFGSVKQFVTFQGIPLFIYTLKTFVDYDKALVVPKQSIKKVKYYIKKHKIKNVEIITGGKTRQESVCNALMNLSMIDSTDNVVITDANRPFITVKTVEKCLQLLKIYSGVVTVCNSINTFCTLNDNKIDKVFQRQGVYDLLMPQCFNFGVLFNAHIYTQLTNCTDETQIMKDVYPDVIIKTVSISFWEGLKLTYKEDYDIFKYLLGRNK